jgi:hypothetical protein
MSTLRRDGFASMDAGDKPGPLTTRPITFQGDHLFVNLDAPQGRRDVPPRTVESCAAIRCQLIGLRIRCRDDVA